MLQLNGFAPFSLLISSWSMYKYKLKLKSEKGNNFLFIDVLDILAFINK